MPHRQQLVLFNKNFTKKAFPLFSPSDFRAEFSKGKEARKKSAYLFKQKSLARLLRPSESAKNPLFIAIRNIGGRPERFSNSMIRHPSTMEKIQFSLSWHHISLGLIAITLSACQSTPPPAGLNSTPDLQRFNRFQLTAQSASGSAAPQQRLGTLEFKRAASLFEASNPGGAADRLFVQPETCRDDASPDCLRRFVISGRLAIENTAVNCYVPIRNDSDLGYGSQSLTGICQDRHSRLFSLTIFSR